jgi:hypothetical protein
VNEEALAQWGAVTPKEKRKIYRRKVHNEDLYN